MKWKQFLMMALGLSVVAGLAMLIFPVSVVFGCIAIALMLPRPHSLLRPLGVLFGLAALTSYAYFLIEGFVGYEIGFHVESILFFGFSTLAVLGGVGLTVLRNPARGAISFALVILSVCGLFLLLAAPFLMAATLIIYAGAIIVTFLFVLMLSQPTGMNDADDRTREPFYTSVAGSLILGVLLIVLQNTYQQPVSPTDSVDNPSIERLLASTVIAANSNSVQEMREIFNARYPSSEGGNKGANGVALYGELLANLVDANKRSIASTNISANRPSKTYTDRLKNQLNLLLPLSENIPAELNKPSPDIRRLKELLSEAEVALARLKLIREGNENPYREGLNQSASYVLTSPYARVYDLPTRDNGTKPGLESLEAARNKLPERNVAAVGRALYTDHLLAIELGGTLLLVATIGAIAVAGTRQEKWA